MRALLVKSRSRYAATRVFIDEIALALERNGHSALVVDVSEEASDIDHVAEAARGQSFDFVYSIGLLGELRGSTGLGVTDAVGAPHVLQYVDYPLSHYTRLADTPQNTALLTIDPLHVDAIRSIYGPERFAHVAFSPHGGIGDPVAPQPDAEAYVAGRDIPILFPATFYKPAATLWKKLGRATARVFDAAVEICLAAEFVPALEAFDQALAAHGHHLTAAARQDLRVNAFAVHEHVRAQRRLDLLKAAARSGLPIHVAGGGYARDLYRFRNVTHLGEKTLREVVDLMRRSRLVLSANANFGHGSHERPLTAMLAGAVASSDHSTFYDETVGNEAMFQFRWMSLDGDLARLGDLVAAPDRLHAMALAGHRKAVDGHRWDHRLNAIQAAADAVRSKS